MNFQPEHFPVGTQFTLNPDASSFTKPPQEVMTVVAVRRNGIRSYILDTGIPHLALGKDMTYRYNIEHVGAIVKRGDGPTKIDHRFFGVSSPHLLEANKRDYEQFRLRGTFQITRDGQYGEDRWRRVRTSDLVPWTPRSSEYACTNLHSLLVLELVKCCEPQHMIDLERMLKAIHQQSWVKRYCVNGRWMAYSVNLKRFRRFVKANWTRFLVNYDAAEKAEQREMDEAMNDSFDREYEDRNIPSEDYENDPPALDWGDNPDWKKLELL